MTKSLSAFLILLFLAGPLSLRVVALPQRVDPIPAIRKQYAAINKRVARYRKVKKELSGYSLEGGELVAYFDRGAVVKIVARHYGEGGNTLEEYYYANDQLIFVFEKVSHYNRPLSGKVVITIENRYYFNDDDLIRWVYGKGNAVSHDEDYRLKEKGLLEFSNKFLIAARSPQRIVEANN
jgi:hypothetical protein